LQMKLPPPLLYPNDFVIYGDEMWITANDKARKFRPSPKDAVLPVLTEMTSNKSAT
jgi:hypothetical protein